MKTRSVGMICSECRQCAVFWTVATASICPPRLSIHCILSNKCQLPGDRCKRASLIKYSLIKGVLRDWLTVWSIELHGRPLWRVMQRREYYITRQHVGGEVVNVIEKVNGSFMADNIINYQMIIAPYLFPFHFFTIGPCTGFLFNVCHYVNICPSFRELWGTTIAWACNMPVTQQSPFLYISIFTKDVCISNLVPAVFRADWHYAELVSNMYSVL